MSNSYYNYTDGVPAAITRGVSSLMRGEFTLIGQGFDAVGSVILGKGSASGQVWTGQHDFSGAAWIKVPTLAQGASGSYAASVDYVNAQAFAAALPGQARGFLVSDGTTASFSQSFTGYAVNESKGADIASAATINLTTATGNLVHVTGTTTITAITLPVGAERTVVFDGSLTLTNGAALILPGGANIVTQPGDSMRVRGDTAGARVVGYTCADGRAVNKPGMDLIAWAPITAAAANIDYLTLFTSTYDKYVIELAGVMTTASGNVVLTLAKAGASDGANIYNCSINLQAVSTTAGVTLTNSGTTSTAAAGGLTATIEVRNANDAVHGKGISARGMYYSSSPAWSAFNIEAAYQSANTVTGFRLACVASTFASGTVRVYGIKNS